jgi:hypothetical protein
LSIICKQALAPPRKTAAIPLTKEVAHNLGAGPSDTLFEEFLGSIEFPVADTNADIHLQKYEQN